MSFFHFEICDRVGVCGEENFIYLVASFHLYLISFSKPKVQILSNFHFHLEKLNLNFDFVFKMNLI